MPIFKQLDGQTLQLGKEGMYLKEDEKAFTLMLDKQLRAADLTDKVQNSAIQHNLNQIAKILQLGYLPEDGVIDEEGEQICSLRLSRTSCPSFQGRIWYSRCLSTDGAGFGSVGSETDFHPTKVLWYPYPPPQQTDFERGTVACMLTGPVSKFR